MSNNIKLKFYTMTFVTYLILHFKSRSGIKIWPNHFHWRFELKACSKACVWLKPLTFISFKRLWQRLYSLHLSLGWFTWNQNETTLNFCKIASFQVWNNFHFSQPIEFTVHSKLSKFCKCLIWIPGKGDGEACSTKLLDCS